MAEASELMPLASWHQEPTSARGISDALTTLWQDAERALQQAGAAPAQEKTNVITRTSVLNFLVYTASRGVSERAAAAITHLGGTHPSRSVILLAQPDDPNASLGVSMWAYSHTASESHSFFFEQIEITARGGKAERLPDIATQLVIHDLPTLLWWPGNPPIDSATFAAMADICDTLIVDSSDFSDPLVELSALAEFACSDRRRCAVTDLNWDRLTNWRDLVAQFFDAPAFRPYLDQIRDVEIEFGHDPGVRGVSAQALMLMSWLASRLEWEIASVSATPERAWQIQMRRAEVPVAVELRSVGGRHRPPGSLVAVRVHCTSPEGNAGSFTVEVSEDGEHAATTMELDNGPLVSRTFQMEQPSESTLLSEEIEATGSERAFGDALQLAGRLNKQLAASPDGSKASV